MPDVFIYSSQLASLIGQNIHKSWQEAFEVLWKRLDYDGYHDAMCRNHVVTDEERVRSLSKEHIVIPELLTPPDPTLGYTSASVSEGYKLRKRVLQCSLKDKVSSEDMEILDNTLRRNMYTQYGDLHEEKVFQHINSSVMRIIKDDQFHQTKLFVYNGYNVFLAGRVDGLSESRSVVIEIKNRINRLFTYKTPRHEFIQCQCYLQLLREATHCLLVECLTKSDETRLVHVQKIHRDVILWEDQILPKIRYMVQFLVDLIHSPNLQDDYVRTKRHSSWPQR